MGSGSTTSDTVSTFYSHRLHILPQIALLTSDNANPVSIPPLNIAILTTLAFFKLGDQVTKVDFGITSAYSGREEYRRPVPQEAIRWVAD